MKRVGLVLLIFVLSLGILQIFQSPSYGAQPPNPVSRLKAASDYAGNIHLTWEASQGAQGYIIYRKVGNSGRFTYRYVVPKTSFWDTTAPKGVFSFYRVYPYKTVGGKKIAGKSVGYVYSKPVVVPRGRVTNLQAKAVGPGRILLTWSLTGEADGYIIYRKVDNTGEFRYRYIVKNRTFVDGTAVNGVNNFYRVYPYKTVHNKRVLGYSDNYHYARPKAFQPYQVYVNTSALNIRTKPYGEYLGETYRYDVHTVYGGAKDSDGRVWFKIRYNGRDAYIASWFTKKGNPPKGKPIAITFDDGPSYLTSSILSSLDETDAKVTFFVLGQTISGKENIVKRAHNAGHEIGNHSWSHPELNRYYYNDIYNELSPTNNKIKSIIGSYPKVMRPPYGSFDNDVKAVCRDLGLALIMWDVDTEDWRYRDADYVERYILNHAAEGSIVLLHDIHPTSVAGFKRALPKLIERGYRLVTVSELMRLKGIDMKPGSVYYDAR